VHRVARGVVLGAVRGLGGLGGGLDLGLVDRQALGEGGDEVGPVRTGPGGRPGPRVRAGGAVGVEDRLDGAGLDAERLGDRGRVVAPGGPSRSGRAASTATLSLASLTPSSEATAERSW
jgi:hypothetical protein